MVYKMLMRKSAAKMTGLTLLESLFVLAIGAVVLFAVIILYKSITLNANVSQVMSDMNSIRAGYKAYRASNYTFNAKNDADQLQAVQVAGFLPSILNDPWGLPYVVSLSWYGGYITIAIPGLDVVGTDSRCTAIWKAAQATGASSVRLSSGYNCAFRYRFP